MVATGAHIRQDRTDTAALHDTTKASTESRTVLYLSRPGEEKAPTKVCVTDSSLWTQCLGVCLPPRIWGNLLLASVHACTHAQTRLNVTMSIHVDMNIHSRMRATNDRKYMHITRIYTHTHTHTCTPPAFRFVGDLVKLNNQQRCHSSRLIND